MHKDELKTLVKKYFNLTENKETLENTVEEQNFQDATLADGTKITNMLDADFEVGQELHVITEEGEHVLAPSGEHTTESGIVITVDGEGIITGVKHPDQEGEGSLEAAKEEMAEHPEDEETMMDIRETIIEAIAEVVAPELESMKKHMAEIEEKMKDYMSATPSAVPTAEAKFAKIQEVKKNGPKGNTFNAKDAQKEMILKAWKNKQNK